MKNRFCFVLVFIFTSLSLVSALDYGLVLKDDSSVSGSDSASFTQINTARAWFSLPLAPTTDLFISAFYTFKGTFSESDTKLIPWRFDVGRTELSGQAPLSVFYLNYSLGRININDFSNRLIIGLSDGASVDAAYGNINVYARAAYRGFLFKEDARSFLETEDYDIFDDDDVYFALPRVVSGLGLKFIEYVPWHDVGLEVWTQFDVDPSGPKTNTQYIEPYVEGRIGRTWRWRAWGIVETSYIDDFSDFSFALASGARIRYSKPELRGFTLTQSLVWASGPNDEMVGFTPIYSTSIGSIASRPFSDILSYSLDLSITPMRHLNLGLGATTLFRSSEDLSTYEGLRPDAEGSYLGAELTALAALRPTSDFSVELSGGLYFPNTTTMYLSNTKLQWTAGLTVELKL
ncbi:hypothetical protein MASR2M78_34540 [Treponema sp.]